MKLCRYHPVFGWWGLAEDWAGFGLSSVGSEGGGAQEFPGIDTSFGTWSGSLEIPSGAETTWSIDPLIAGQPSPDTWQISIERVKYASVDAGEESAEPKYLG